MADRSEARKNYAIAFDAPPLIGTQINYRGQVAELVAVEPYIRKRDGQPSFILRWRIGGRLATSGLRSDSVMWERECGDAS